MDKVIGSIVEDDVKVEILAYLYQKNNIDLQDVKASLNLEFLPHDDFNFLLKHNILARRGNRYNLTRSGNILAYGLKEFSLANESPYSFWSKLAIKDGAAILDLGCGAGQCLITTQGYAPKFAIGIDNDSLLLTVAKYLNRKYAFSPSLALADAHKLPFKDNTFNYVLCRLVLPYIRNRETIAEISRVTKEQGRIYLALHGIGYYIRSLRDCIYERNVLRFLYTLFVILNGTIFHFTGRQMAIKLPFYDRSVCTVFQTLKRTDRVLAMNGFRIVDYEINEIKIMKLLNIPYTMEIIASKRF